VELSWTVYLCISAVVAYFAVSRAVRADIHKLSSRTNLSGYLS
jgi:hypothetical protein